MIRAILFDMGGTLDGDGQHWLDRFLGLYRAYGIDLPRETIRGAFDQAERQASTDEEIATASLPQMIGRHVQWQLAQGAAHGSKTHGRNGAIGNRSTPGRIWKNMGMPGHMGDERVTVQNLQVMQVREAEKVILISGAVPGPNGSYVVVRPAIKRPAKEGAKQ